MSKINVVAKKALSAILMITVGSFYSLITSTAFAQISPKLVGYLATKGQVTLNGINAISGATVFGGSQIKTAATGSAIISLGKMGQIEVEPESELTLRLEAGVIGGYLRSGRATISAPTGVAVNLATADGVAVADGKQASVLTVDVTSGNTRVASVRSEAKVTAGDQVEVVAAGQEVSVGASATGTTAAQVKTAPPVIFAGISTPAMIALVGLGVVGAGLGIFFAVQGDGNTGSNIPPPLSNFTPS